MSQYPKIHISVSVSDLAASVQFYTRFLGKEPEKVEPGYAKFLPDFAPLNLTLESGHGITDQTAHVGHMGIQVDSRATVDTHLARIKETGIEVLEEMNVDCCYANQDKFWVTDPDGMRWEMYVLNRDIDRMGHSPALACCEEAESVASSSETAACCTPTCCS